MLEYKKEDKREEIIFENDIVKYNVFINDKLQYRRLPDYKLSYFNSKSCMSKFEQILFDRLQKVCIQNNLYVFPQISLSSFISPNRLEFKNNSNIKNSEYMKIFETYKNFSIDFLICNHNLEIVCGIELMESSHNKSYRIINDELKKDIFKQVNIPLHFLYVSDDEFYDFSELKKILKIV